MVQRNGPHTEKENAYTVLVSKLGHVMGPDISWVGSNKFCAPLQYTLDQSIMLSAGPQSSNEKQ